MENQLINIEASMDKGIHNAENASFKLLSLEALISLRKIITNAKKERPVTQAEANMFNLAIETFFKEDTKSLAIENFKSEFNSNVNTNIALENIDSKIQDLFNELVDWSHSAVTWLNSSLQQFEDVYKELGDLSVRLNGLANEKDNNVVPRTKLIEDNLLAQFFYAKENITGTAQPYTAEDISNNYTQHIQLSSPVFCVQFISALTDQLSFIEQQIKDDKGIDNLLSNITIAIDVLLTQKLSFLHKNDSIQNVNIRHDVYSYHFSFGHQIFQASLTSEENRFKALSISIIRDPNIAKLPDGIYLHVLDVEQIKNLTNKIQNEVLFGNVRNISKLTQEVTRLQNVINDILVVITHDQQDNYEVDVTTLNFIKDIINSVLMVLVQMYKYDTLISRKILEYCEKSLNSY